MWRSRAGAVGLAAATALTAVVLAGCGGTPLAQPAPDAGSGSPSSSSSPEQSAPLWPDAARTVAITPKGERPPMPAPDEAELQDLTSFAAQEGMTVEAMVREQQDVRAFHDWVASTVRPILGDRYSEARPEMEGDPAWIGFTGDVPPELVAAAEAFYLPMELRGGALLTEAEADRVRSVGTDAFAAAAPKGFGWSGSLDTPTATFTYSGIPAEQWQGGDEVKAAVVAAAAKALGRDAPFRVEVELDDRDPKTTEPAFWYLPAGWTADPTATSIEVTVDSPQCASGVNPGERMAPPQVEVTDTQVRIAVSTYILKGPQTCPGHGTAPLVVELGQPLGDRTLVDVNGALREGRSAPSDGLVAPAAG
ncbi:hypothetical protein [Quadrisphaera granulorum]|uniref:hypothetical protein n=1 Tax=Quadrisphaera granulorum TaxID=317664 RepID=UPI0014755F16|nr:hypothetical protein [Quadrisphaera granulorum]